MRTLHVSWFAGAPPDPSCRPSDVDVGQLTALREVRFDPRPAYANYGYQYWRQTPDGRLLIGGWRNMSFDTEAVDSNETTPLLQDAIEQGLRDLVPEGAPVEYRWAGTMGFARDGRPLVGWLDAAHHLAICAGFTGHGMGLATACTEDLAQILAFKRAPMTASFDPQRFVEVRDARDAFTHLGDANH